MPESEPPTSVRFSIIPAVYNVARYLPQFIRSVDAQEFTPGELEVIAVDDGSEDDSLRLLREWAQRAPYRVTVLSKPNGGQSTARNLGLEHAAGQWVTFTDPDDMLDAGYLRSVGEFIALNPETEMIATNRIFYDDGSADLRDAHPLKAHFESGNQVVDLDLQPGFFHGSAPAAFFKLSRIRHDGLSFDERIRPNFEDGHFCARYLMGAESRKVGFVADARYLYRKRSDSSSTLQNSLMDPRRYNVVPELGYLDVLRRSIGTGKQVPEWLQNFIIYELSWYFSAEEAPNSSATAASGEVAEAFHALMPQIVSLLSPQVIRSFDIRRLSPITRELLLHGWSGQEWHTPYAVVDNLDDGRGLARVVHRYVGDPPGIEYFVDGLPVQPRHTKVRHIRYFDRAVMFERIAWVSNRGTLRVRIADDVVPIRRGFEGAVPTSSKDHPQPLGPATRPLVRPNWRTGREDVPSGNSCRVGVGAPWSVGDGTSMGPGCWWIASMMPMTAPKSSSGTCALIAPKSMRGSRLNATLRTGTDFAVRDTVTGSWLGAGCAGAP